MTTLLERPSGRPDNRVALHRLPTVRSRFWTLDRVVGVVVALLGATVVASGVNLFPALLGDEGIYTNQARSILHGEISPYTYTYDHPFFGWLQLAPLQGLVHLVGGDQLTVVSGRIVMVLYAFASLLFVYHIGSRLGLRRAYAAAAPLILALSPLFVVESRQVLLDNLALPWVLCAFYLVLNPGRRQWLYGLAGISFAVGVLSKETMMIALPALGYLVWTRSYRPIRAMSVAAFVTLGLSVLAVYPLFALLRNELFPGPGHVSLWTNGIAYQLGNRTGSGAFWSDGSSRHMWVDAWLNLDTGLIVAGLAAAACCLFVRRLRFIAILILLWAVQVVKPSGYLPSMYVVLAIPFFALAVAGLADALTTGLQKVLAPRVAVASVAVVAAALSVLALTYYVPEDLRVSTDSASDQVRPTAQAEAYLEAHITKADNVLVDPAYWSDLIDAGYHGPWQGAIAYYQFDLDPISRARYLPQGWKDIDYVVDTAEMDRNLQHPGSLPNLRLAVEHSTVVAEFGSGDSRVRIREVQVTDYNRRGDR